MVEKGFEEPIDGTTLTSSQGGCAEGTKEGSTSTHKYNHPPMSR